MSDTETPSPATELTRPVTLENLYHSLDWSGVDGALSAWEERHRPQLDPTPDWKDRWRLTLLLHALPPGMAPCPTWSEDRMQDARAILSKMGVWNQVAPWLLARGLLSSRSGGILPENPA